MKIFPLVFEISSPSREISGKGTNIFSLFLKMTRNVSPHFFPNTIIFFSSVVISVMVSRVVSMSGTEVLSVLETRGIRSPPFGVYQVPSFSIKISFNRSCRLRGNFFLFAKRVFFPKRYD
jgi:hypothetical protein